MKKITTLIVMLVLCAASLFAQAPEKFTYQAVVRNANNTLVANAQVGVRVNILQGTATGNAVYSETHMVSSNANGLVTLNIGAGSVLHGSFANIDWADGPYFLKTDIDPNGGNDYNITSTQQLLSVPYALYAKEAANSFSGDYNDLTNTPQIPTVPTNISAFTNDAGYITSYTETDPVFNAWDKNYNDLTNRPQIPTVPTNVSSFTNDAGYITAMQVPAAQVNADWTAVSGAAQILNKPTLFSGNYSDLVGKPTNLSQFNNDLGLATVATSGSYNDLNYRPNLATVATTGNYNDLSNRPTIPTVPTNVSAFTNDAGYVTSADVQQAAGVPTNVSAFQNDAGYITATQVPAAQVNADWNATSGAARILNKPTLFSGNYNDLTNKPTIPTVPSNVSVFNNDAHYITEAQLNALLASMNSTIDSLRDRVEELENNPPAPQVGLPTVVTMQATNITGTSAQCGGNIPSDGGSAITARGICWSTSQNPTINDSHTNDGSGTGSFSSSITELTPNTTYYVRAYATNSAGTSYGEQRSFTTASSGGIDVSIDSKSCPSTPTVTDHEGNVYATVQIGNQCWMRENLRTTTSPSTGTYLITSANNYTFTGKQARWYNNDSTTYAPMKCGLLYNWNAAVDTFNTSFGEISVNTSISNGVSVSFTGHRRGICPVGWHLPSDAEWTQLTNYVSRQSEYVCGGNSNYIAKALADSIGWHSSTNTYYGTCAVYYNLAANNATGFSAFPAGAYGYTGDYLDLGDGAYFFSSSQYNVYDAYNRSLHCDMAEVYEGNDSYKANGLSVRCLRD